MNVYTINKILILTALSIPLNALAAVIYVNASAMGNNTGVSWSNAYTDLQSALTTAAAFDEIRVAAGIYKPTTSLDRTASFTIPNHVSLYGGFGGETILSGDLLSNDIMTPPGAILDVASHMDNSYHVVTANNASFLMNKFTISGGYNEANGTIGQPGSNAGTGRVTGAGLIYINGDTSNSIVDHNTVILEKMLIKDNFINGQINSNGAGGGASFNNPNAINGDTVALVIKDSAFINNHASRLVGALDITNVNAAITHTRFDYNRTELPFSSSSGCGALSISAATNVPDIVGVIEHSFFTNNRAGGGGGALNVSGATTYISHTNFINNSNYIPGFAFRGGALFTSSNDTYISHSHFKGNSTSFAGGAIVTIGPSTATAAGKIGSLTIDHTTFNDNYTEGANVTQLGGAFASIGGAIADFFVPVVITNSTFDGNIAKNPLSSVINRPNVGGGAIATFRLSTQRYIDTITINDTKFTNNSTLGDGGALLDTASINLTINNSHFTNNSAGKNGGAVFSTDSGVPTTQVTPINRFINIFSNHFMNNTAIIGGDSMDYIDNTGSTSVNLEILTANLDKNKVK